MGGGGLEPPEPIVSRLVGDGGTPNSSAAERRRMTTQVSNPVRILFSFSASLLLCNPTSMHGRVAEVCAKEFLFRITLSIRNLGLLHVCRIPRKFLGRTSYRVGT